MIVRESINFNQLSDPFDSLRIGEKLIEIHLITVESPGNGIDEVYILSEAGCVKCLEMLQSGKNERNDTYKFTVTPQTDEEWNKPRVVLTLPQVAGNRIEFNGVIYKIPRSLKESIQSFERSDNPKQSMGIGKRVKIEEWLKEMHIENWKINKDLTIDIGTPELGDTVALEAFELTELPPYIQFGIVYGGFNISRNQLTSLKGCPHKVLETKHWKGNFKCHGNELKSLEFAPKEIDGAFICYDNPGKFRRIDVNHVCKVNQIWGEEKNEGKSIKESMDFERGRESFDAMEIGQIPQIRSWIAKTGLKEDEYVINSDRTIDVFQDINMVGMGLIELPHFINFRIAYANFYAAHNRFISLEGFPKEVHGDFSIYSEHQEQKIWKEDEIRSKIEILGTIYN